MKEDINFQQYQYNPADQVYPTPSSFGLITEAIIPLYLNDAITLISYHFSPNVSRILPLIAYKMNNYGLDFRSCRTTVIFGDAGDTNPTGVIPKGSLCISGAVFWRLHKPAKSSNLQNTKNVLEVLFLAVTRRDRELRLGRLLVDTLSAIALAEDCPILYVEIAHDTQPAAGKFWEHQGMKKVSELEMNEAQLLFFENHCLRFIDTVQYAVDLKKVTTPTNAANG